MTRPHRPAIDTIAMEETGSHDGRMWPSFETASRLYDVANFAFIASLVIGVVATVTLVWMGNVKETYLRRDVARAGLSAADANERTAKLENENLRLKSKLQPRRLTKEQYDALQTLRGKIRAINVVLLNDDLEANSFGMQIVRALSDTGMQVKIYEGNAVRGQDVTLYDKHAFENPNGKPTGDEPIVGVLKKMGVFSGAIFARLPNGLNAPPDIPVIFVGEKPPLDTPAPYLGPRKPK